MVEAFSITRRKSAHRMGVSMMLSPGAAESM